VVGEITYRLGAGSNIATGSRDFSACSYSAQTLELGGGVGRFSEAL